MVFHLPPGSFFCSTLAPRLSQNAVCLGKLPRSTM